MVCPAKSSQDISFFFVDGITISGWIPLLLFTFYVLLSDDETTLIATSTSNSFLTFSKITETQSNGMLKRSVRLKSLGINGNLLCQTLISLSNSGDVLFSLHEEIVETDKVVFNAYTKFEWHFLDIIFLSEFNDYDNFNPKLLQLHLLMVYFL